MQCSLKSWYVILDLVVFQRAMMLSASSAVNWATCQSSCSALAVGSITMATVSVPLWRSSPLSGLAGSAPTARYVRPAGQSHSHKCTHAHIHTHTQTHSVMTARYVRPAGQPHTHTEYPDCKICQTCKSVTHSVCPNCKIIRPAGQSVMHAHKSVCIHMHTDTVS